MTTRSANDAIFSTVIGKEYEMLKLICPASTEMSCLVGVTVGTYPHQDSEELYLVELGGGTGITTLSILSAHEHVKILSIDSEPTMQNQAKQHLAQWVQEGRLSFSGDDALTALQKLADNSVDIVATAYTTHNFLHSYREQVLKEIFRVLKPKGLFVNGDRYGLDDLRLHTQTIQDEVKSWFKVLTPLKRNDLLEQWLVHLFNDESEDHLMRESVAFTQMQAAGFINIELTHRQGVSALVTAYKPGL